MAVTYADRVKETWSGTGTGAVSLGGAITGYESFQDNFTTGNTTHYCIENPGTGEWELGLGTLTSGTPWTLTRTTVLASSNANAAVNFSAGTKNVFVDLPASVIVLIQTAVQNTRQIVAGAGLSGGGDFSADRTIALALTSAIVTTALGYTPLNSSSYTASDVLTKVKTVDGSGSGLDADTVDGQHASAFLTSSGLASGIAGMAAGAVGTYALLKGPASSSQSFGNTVAGSSLGTANCSGSNVGASLSGTWMCMGQIPSITTAANLTTLWMRIS